jgi:hypothetical protein
MIIVKDFEGKKFRVYNISKSWVAIIPIGKEISDKILIPIGDFYEYYEANRLSKIYNAPVKYKPIFKD